MIYTALEIGFGKTTVNWIMVLILGCDINLNANNHSFRIIYNAITKHNTVQAGIFFTL